MRRMSVDGKRRVCTFDKHEDLTPMLRSKADKEGTGTYDMLAMIALRSIRT